MNYKVVFERNDFIKKHTKTVLNIVLFQKIGCTEQTNGRPAVHTKIYIAVCFYLFYRQPKIVHLRLPILFVYTPEKSTIFEMWFILGNFILNQVSQPGILYSHTSSVVHLSQVLTVETITTLGYDNHGD